MPTSASTLKFFRQFHRWTGLFIAPSLLFFALTGALQTFSLHETTKGSSYKPAAWIVTLAQVHKHQTDAVPVKKAAPGPEKPVGDKLKVDGGASTVKAAAVPASPPVPQKSHLPLKVFFLIVSVGLFCSTLTGIFMAYRYGGSKVVVTGLLVAGVVVPLVLLRF